MTDPELFVVISSDGTAWVSATPVEGSFPQTIVYPISPGESVEDVPYEAWRATIGATVDVEELQGGVRRGVMPELVPRDPLTKATCPRCGADMVSGEVFLDSTTFDRLLAGVSAQRLFFKADGARHRNEVLAHGAVAYALRCPDCESVLVL